MRSARRREVAIRLSLGASRWRLVQQLLTESLLLSGIAGVIGIVVAYWTSGVLMAFAPPTDMPIEFGLRVDGWTLVYAAAVSVVTGVVFGLAPALQASRPNTVHALKEEAGRGSGGRTGQRLRGTLVVVQVAVCLVLLVGASLFVRSLQAAQDVNPGFDPDGVLIASVDLLPNGYTPDTGRQFHRRLDRGRRGAARRRNPRPWRGRCRSAWAGRARSGAEIAATRRSRTKTSTSSTTSSDRATSRRCGFRSRPAASSRRRIRANRRRC